MAISANVARESIYMEQCTTIAFVFPPPPLPPKLSFSFCSLMGLGPVNGPGASPLGIKGADECIPNRGGKSILGRLRSGQKSCCS